MLRVRGVRIGSRFLRTALGDPVAGAARRCRRRPTPSATPARTLGRLEQESVDDAMASLGVHVDPAPQGKTIGKIHVVNQEVFSRRDWYFQLFNIFHWTTRALHPRARAAAQARAALRPGAGRGEHAQPAVAAGAHRRRDGRWAQPELSSVVVHPAGRVGGPRAGRSAAGHARRLEPALQHQLRIPGERADAARDVAVREQPVRLAQVPVARLQLRPGEVLLRPDLLRSQHPRHAPDAVRAGALLHSRETGDYEGNSQIASVRYPLYSLASRWGAGVDVTHASNGRAQLPGQQPPAGRPGRDAASVNASRTSTGGARVAVDANAVRSFRGAAVIQRVTRRLPRRPAVRRGAADVSGRRGDRGAVPRRSGRRSPSSARSRTCATRCSRPATWCCAISTPSTCARTASSVRCCARGSPKGCPRWAPASPRSASAWRPASRSRRRAAIVSRHRRRVGAGWRTTTGAGSISWAKRAPTRRRRSSGALFRIVVEAQVASKRADTHRTPRSSWAARTGCAATRSASSSGRRVLVGAHRGPDGPDRAIWSQRVGDGGVLRRRRRGAVVLRSAPVQRRRPRAALADPAVQLDGHPHRLGRSRSRTAVGTRAGTPGRFSAGFAQVF